MKKKTHPNWNIKRNIIFYVFYFTLSYYMFSTDQNCLLCLHHMLDKTIEEITKGHYSVDNYADWIRLSHEINNHDYVVRLLRRASGKKNIKNTNNSNTLLLIATA